MKIFVHQGLGHYIGSLGVVIANDEVEALSLLNPAMCASGLSHEEIRFEVFELNDPQIIYFQDGDY